MPCGEIQALATCKLNPLYAFFFDLVRIGFYFVITGIPVMFKTGSPSGRLQAWTASSLLMWCRSISVEVWFFFRRMRETFFQLSIMIGISAVLFLLWFLDHPSCSFFLFFQRITISSFQLGTSIQSGILEGAMQTSYVRHTWSCLFVIFCFSLAIFLGRTNMDSFAPIWISWLICFECVEYLSLARHIWHCHVTLQSPVFYVHHSIMQERGIGKCLCMRARELFEMITIL